MSDDLISRQAAIDALWKALYEYEDKTENQFQESEDLDVGDWIEHRIFVQNMNDIDKQTIINLPSAQPEPQWIPCSEPPKSYGKYLVTIDGFGKYKYVQILCYGDADFADKNPCWYFYDSEYGDVTVDNVLAWMPLPEPWKGEQ